MLSCIESAIYSYTAVIAEATDNLHQLGEYSEQLTDNINIIVNRTRKKIREIDPKVTSETKQLCDQILRMVECAQKYMRDVDGFAWHGKLDGKRESTLQSIDDWEFQPLNVYIGELQECLNRAGWSYENFCQANSDTKRILKQLLKDLKVKKDDAQAGEDTSNLVGGLGVLGALGGAAATIGLGLATGGVGAVAGLAAAASAMSAGVAGVAYSFASEFKNKKEAYMNLAENTRTIQDSAATMQQIVTEINKSLENIGTNVDTIYETTIYGSLLQGLKRLFIKMDELGIISSKCCKQLDSLENELRRSVSILTVQIRQH